MAKSSMFFSLSKNNKQFATKRDIKISSNRLFLPNTEEMKQVFRRFDADKDGKISADELQHVLRSLGKNNISGGEVEEMMRVADSDGDGCLDFKEFMGVIERGGGVKESDIESAFHVFDLDGNGRISEDEVYRVLRSLGEKCSLRDCKKMVKNVDRNGDGQIDLHEFMIMMTNTMKTVH